MNKKFKPCSPIAVENWMRKAQQVKKFKEKQVKEARIREIIAKAPMR